MTCTNKIASNSNSIIAGKCWVFAQRVTYRNIVACTQYSGLQGMMANTQQILPCYAQHYTCPKPFLSIHTVSNQIVKVGGLGPSYNFSVLPACKCFSTNTKHNLCIFEICRVCMICKHYHEAGWLVPWDWLWRTLSLPFPLPRPRPHPRPRPRPPPLPASFSLLTLVALLLGAVRPRNNSSSSLEVTGENDDISEMLLSSGPAIDKGICWMSS